MGTYNLSVEELKPYLEELLQGVGGDVSSLVMAQAWNQLAKENFWSDRLIGITVDMDEVKAEHGNFKKVKKFLANNILTVVDSAGLHTVLEDKKWRDNLLLLCGLYEGLYKGE